MKTAVRSLSISYKRLEGERRRIQEYLLDPLKIVVIPVTTRKSFFYFKHTEDYLNTGNRFIRYERKVADKASATWRKMEESRNMITVRIVGWINLLLAQISWMERSLASFPSESNLLKCARSTTGSKKHVRIVSVGHAVENTEREKQLENCTPSPVHVYYPSSAMSKDSLVIQLTQFWKEGQSYHLKYLFYCLLALPLTIPIALVPLLPNVPGFYLLYRAYCNYKAYVGAKHLESLATSNSRPLAFIDLKEYSDIMSAVAQPKHTKGKAAAAAASERMVLNEPLLHRVLDNLELHELRRDLAKAIAQENRRLDAAGRPTKRKEKSL
ncbi:Mrx19p Ecym_8048 [Eremothecium cymbalariae DBVPG|uniref:Uncharacterized protein n=1 Tax=Eremothecium cymbalariae (strain CBS 270.75 / DBVPG 7215 / KCTC 17166 / NRRL Y-17582) TaxID=931890 RepID=G8JWX0_ERECY|nr:Hypothetical protein Ecym_8048 [Eremothecium cymbalariae DBVPG\